MLELPAENFESHAQMLRLSFSNSWMLGSEGCVVPADKKLPSFTCPSVADDSSCATTTGATKVRITRLSPHFGPELVPFRQGGQTRHLVMRLPKKFWITAPNLRSTTVLCPPTLYHKPALYEPITTPWRPLSRHSCRKSPSIPQSP